MDPWISHLVTFLGGLIIGIIGNYVANRWIEKSKVKDTVKARKEEFLDLKNQTPNLFDEIKQDLKNPDFKNCREFFVSPSQGVVVNHSNPAFFYYEDQHENLMSSIRALEHANFIIDITPGNLPKYQFKEEFVKLILGE